MFYILHLDIMACAVEFSETTVCTALIIVSNILSRQLFTSVCGIIRTQTHLLSAISTIHKSAQRHRFSLFCPLALTYRFGNLPAFIPNLLRNKRLMGILNDYPIFIVLFYDLMILIGYKSSNIAHLRVAKLLKEKYL